MNPIRRLFSRKSASDDRQSAETPLQDPPLAAAWNSSSGGDGHNGAIDGDRLRAQIASSFKALAREVHLIKRTLTQNHASLSNRVNQHIEQSRIDFQAVQHAAARQAQDAATVVADFNDQLAALREYTGAQQELVRRYQEGYDWKITKEFCQRIILVIDDIEATIRKTDSASHSATQLQGIRDQLVYALDASGIEQFTPAPTSDFTPIRDRVQITGTDPTPNPDLAGRISTVITPGYLLRVTDTDIRVIRPARANAFKVTTEKKSNE